MAHITFNAVGACFVCSVTKTPVNFKMLSGKPAAECRRKPVFDAIQVQLLYMYKSYIDAT